MMRSARALDPAMITTNPTLDGHRVVKSLGIAPPRPDRGAAAQRQPVRTDPFRLAGADHR